MNHSDIGVHAPENGGVDAPLPLPGLADMPARTVGDPRSRDRRRTAGQRTAVAEGRHPLTGGRTFPDRGTCGTCVHRYLVSWHAKRYPKCEHYGETHGASTDVRAWWPACSQHEPRTDLPSGP